MYKKFDDILNSAYNGQWSQAKRYLQKLNKDQRWDFYLYMRESGADLGTCDRFLKVLITREWN